MNEPKTIERAEDTGCCGEAPCSASSDALALVDAGPIKTAKWMLCVTPMCRHCLPCEDVDQAAARILAGEVRRLRGEIKELLYMTRTGATKEQLDYRLRGALAEMPNK